MTSTDNGEAATEIESGQLNTLEDATAAFLARHEDAEKLSETGEDDKKKKPDAQASEEKPDTKEDKTKPEDADESQDAEGDGEASEETEETEEDKAPTVADDEAVVKVKVGDEEHDIPVKDLKRLFGQEKALTQKSQEVAETRKKVDAEAARNLAALNVLVERVKQKTEPYKKIDWLVASKQLNAEELTALREQAQAAFDEEKFLTADLDGFMKQVNEAQQQQLAVTARETVKTLGNADSPLHIEGWNEKTYNDLRAFGTEMGLPPEIINNLVEAPALKIMHMAMMFKQGASKVVTQKVNKSPKKIVKKSASPPQALSNVKASKVKKADEALKKDGNIDNAAAAFLARFESDDLE